MIAELALALAPLLALMCALVLRRYPGEDTIELLRARRAAAAPPRARRRLLAPRERPGSPLPRGGELVGSALAGRAPPRSMTDHRFLIHPLAQETHPCTAGSSSPPPRPARSRC